MANEKQLKRWEEWHRKGFRQFCSHCVIRIGLAGGGLTILMIVSMIALGSPHPSEMIAKGLVCLIVWPILGLILSFIIWPLDEIKYRTHRAKDSIAMTKEDVSLIRWVNEKINQGKTAIDVPAELFEVVGDEALNETRRLCKLNNVKINSIYIGDEHDKKLKDAELISWVNEKINQGQSNIDIPSQLLIRSSDRALEDVRRLLKLSDIKVSGIYYGSGEIISKKDESLIKWVNEKINQGDRNINIPSHLLDGVSQDRLNDALSLCKINGVRIYCVRR